MTNDERNLNIGLGVDLDKRSIEAAQAGLKRLGKSAEDAVNVISKPSSAPFNNIETSAESAAKAIDKIPEALKKIPSELSKAQEGFDRINKDVSLAGDFESNLRTAGGAVGAIGGSSAERAIGIGAELPALVEALPRMKESLKGLPATLAASTNALLGIDVSAKVAATGLTGASASMATLALAAAPFLALAAAAAAAAAAFKLLGDRQDDAAKEAEKFVNGLDAFQEATKLTTVELRELQELEADEAKLLERKKEILEERIRAEKDSQNGLQEFGESLGGLWDSGKIDEYQDTIKEYEERLGELSVNQEAYADVLETNANAAADATAALDEMNNALLDRAANEADLLRAQLDAEDRTYEANQDRLDAIAEEEMILRRELEILQQASEKNEETNMRIEELTRQLGNLGKEAQIVGDIASKQGKDSKKTAKDTEKTTRRSNRRRRRSARKTSKSLVKSEEDGAKKRIKAAQDLQMKIADIEFKAQVERQKIAIDGNREQAKILTDAIRSQKDLLFEQDFLGLFKNQEDLVNSLSDAALGTSQALADSLLGQTNSIVQAQAQAGSSVTNNTTNSGGNTITIPISGVSDPAAIAATVQQELAAILG